MLNKYIYISYLTYNCEIYDELYITTIFIYVVWGFGAKYGGVVRHCFQCGSKPEVDGTDGILEAYRQTFQSGLTMSAPTDITEILSTAAACSRSRQEEAKTKGKQAYTILLILTDGVITDIPATSKTILSVSDAPMSVVIVGIGTANFSSMKFLDDLGENRNGNDIVQFVEFNAHKHNPNSLTAETLDEIPKQLLVILLDMRFIHYLL